MNKGYPFYQNESKYVNKLDPFIAKRVLTNEWLEIKNMVKTQEKNMGFGD